MKRVIADTNILVSATFWKGDPFKIVNLIEKNKLHHSMSKETIAEYSRIINSDEIIEKIEKKDLITSKVVKKVISISDIVEPKRKIQVVKDDPDDDKFLEVAVEGRADFIISKDKHLLNLKEFEGIKIVSPDTFLDKYFEEKDD